MSERCYKAFETLAREGCHDHEEFHHAHSMKEIQAAIRKGLKVYDGDGDKVAKARILPHEDRNSPAARGKFFIGGYGFGYEYRVAQILIEDEPLDEEAAEKEVMKSLMASLARG